MSNDDERQARIAQIRSDLARPWQEVERAVETARWLLAELDAALARAEAADKRITEIADSIGAYRYWRTNDDVMMYSCRFCPSSREAVGAEGPHQHHRVCVLNPDYEAGMQAARKDIEARAALAARQEGGDE